MEHLHVKHEIRYGKAEVSFYRTQAAPLMGVAAIPESSFTGRDNTIFAGAATIDVFGDNFLPAYTEGDNSMVVATDTMKNFVYATALEFDGATHEQFADHLACRFLETYPQMQRLRVTIKELPFAGHSDKLLSPRGDDHGWVRVERDGTALRSLQSGRRNLRLVKLTGSSFASFVRDDYTTLPERQDRPLYIWLDVLWRYADPADATGGDLGRYVAPEQVADLVRAVFDRFVSMSIQHLVHEMGMAMLDRWPQLDEVSFEAQNRLWDTSATSERDPRLKVYSNPKPAQGLIGLTLHR
jgi:urate oxidase